MTLQDTIQALPDQEQDGRRYTKGEPALDNGALYVAQRDHKATTTNRPTKGTADWLKLG